MCSSVPVTVVVMVPYYLSGSPVLATHREATLLVSRPPHNYASKPNNSINRVGDWVRGGEEIAMNLSHQLRKGSDSITQLRFATK